MLALALQDHSLVLDILVASFAVEPGPEMEAMSELRNTCHLKYKKTKIWFRIKAEIYP